MTIHPFDLQARAELAIQSLTALLDPEREGLMYFLADWQSRPPRADHCLWDYGDGSGRHMDALVLARSMVRQGSGAVEANSGERQIEAWMMRLLGEDGLTWLVEEPFASPWGQSMLYYGERTHERMAEISWAQRGTLLGLTSCWLATGDERFHSAACRLIDGLLQIAVRHPKGIYFPEGYYRVGGWKTDTTRLAIGIEEYNAAVLWPAVRFYAASGYAPALELAEGVAQFALQQTQGYLPTGAIAPVKAELEDHFHTRGNFMLGILKLGLVTGHPEYVAWARQGYDHARTVGTDFGWFPEGIKHRHGEVCCITDMLELALLLGKHVDPAYYADAERYGRNHLIEGQYLDLESLQQAVDRLPTRERAAPHEGRYSTYEGVVASQVGAFASRSTLNDAFHTDVLSMMQCCNAAGTRGMYDLWRYAMDSQPAQADQLPHHQINLRFSVATPDLQVISHEPTSGRLDITAQTPCQVSIRLPAGEEHAFFFTLGDVPNNPQPQLLATEQGYVHFVLAAGASAQVHYRLRERSASYTVGKPERSITCTGHWRGETLMKIEPAGEFLPLYRRSADLSPVQPFPVAGRLIESI
ncbi:MAG: hypothetical protein U0175_29005 [Caldilineaceae bacterium]